MCDTFSEIETGNNKEEGIVVHAGANFFFKVGN